MQNIARAESTSKYHILSTAHFEEGKGKLILEQRKIKSQREKYSRSTGTGDGQR
jgi:hypothetical protein